MKISVFTYRADLKEIALISEAISFFTLKERKKVFALKLVSSSSA